MIDNQTLNANRSFVLAQPHLALQLAFDACIAEACRYGPRPILIASTPFYRSQLAWRLGGDLPLRTGQAPVMIWAEPERRDWQIRLSQLDVSLPRGGYFIALTHGRLYRLLSEAPKLTPETLKSTWRKPAYRAPITDRLMEWLTTRGYRITGRYGFYGPRAFAWATLNRLGKRIGRDDWADRWACRMRANLVETSWLADWAAIILIVACKSTCLDSAN